MHPLRLLLPRLHAEALDELFHVLGGEAPLPSNVNVSDTTGTALVRKPSR
jgi:hypothetical protein